MGVTSNRSVEISFAGVVEYDQTFNAATVSTGSGQIQQITLASGNNTITVPTSAIAATIVPPAGNTVALTLKGVNGDTGIALNVTDPTSIGLNGSVTTFVINAGSTVTIRIIYN